MNIENVHLPTKSELRRRLGVRKYTDAMRTLKTRARECRSVEDYKDLLLEAGWRDHEVQVFLKRARNTVTVQ